MTERDQQSQGDSLVGRLVDPERAGRLQGRITQYENDPFVVGVEQQLRCTCGCNLSVYTCRTTDFTCETSPAMHARVIALVEQRQSADQILDAFVTQYGEAVLMSPPKQGFNLAGYLVPGVLISIAAGVLAWVIVRRTRNPALASAGTRHPTPDTSSAVPSDTAAKLRSELEQLEL